LGVASTGNAIVERGGEVDAARKMNSDETQRAKPAALAVRGNEMALGEMLILIINGIGKRRW
jgi:hypothetical protein